ASDAPSGGSCPLTWQAASASCGAPPATAPATSLADCSAGVDPTKMGGDLLWVTHAEWFYGLCPPNWGSRLTTGPTGDAAFGTTCMTEPDANHGAAFY